MNDTKTKAVSERTVTVVSMTAPLPRRKRVAAYARVSVEKDSIPYDTMVSDFVGYG